MKALSQVESIEALRPDDIADAVSYIVTPDRRVAVTEILVRTTEQSWLNVGSPHPRRCPAARFRRGHFLVGTLSSSAEPEGDPLFKREVLSMRSPTDVTNTGSRADADAVGTRRVTEVSCCWVGRSVAGTGRRGARPHVSGLSRSPGSRWDDAARRTKASVPSTVVPDFCCPLHRSASAQSSA